MKVLLSIKPEYAFKIFDGTKLYEFRKVIFKNKEVKTVIVYASSPVKKVIGEFDIEKVLVDNPENIWDKTKTNSGITKEFFDSYFAKKKYAFAIKVKKTKRYDLPKELKKDYDISFAPQSFIYLL